MPVQSLTAWRRRAGGGSRGRRTHRGLARLLARQRTLRKLPSNLHHTRRRRRGPGLFLTVSRAPLTLLLGGAERGRQLPGQDLGVTEHGPDNGRTEGSLLLVGAAFHTRASQFCKGALLAAADSELWVSLCHKARSWAGLLAHEVPIWAALRGTSW